MCREPTTRKWLRVEQLRKGSWSTHQNSVTYLDSGEATYASQVQDVLITYTTREDTYNYYEERNYVNDVNREHTEVLETYDHDGKARETYSYGKGRASYLNNQTGDSYNYLTNQSGSVTGLTKDGQAVASSAITSLGQERQAQTQ